MTSTTDILTQIEDTITDWETSPDAMRSRPASNRQDEAHLDEAGTRTPAGVAMVNIEVDFTPLPRAFSRIGEVLRGLDLSVWALHTDELDELQAHRTRRTVQVATRKYRARRKR